MLQSFQPPWWKRAVIYQVYPRSFTDSDGDLPGLVARLDHLRRLGGDALGPSPVYRSPAPGAAAADRHHPSFRHVRLSAREPRRARGWR
jgi:hypothetical protein